MKRKLQIITSASAASFLAFTALAQETPSAKKGRTEITQERSTHAMRAERLGRAEKASDLIGMEVKNYEGEKLGKVHDLAADLETGRIVQVILSTGGFIGVGDTLVAVPPGALHHDVANKVIHLKADKEKLKAAPKFEMSKWAECCEPSEVAKVYRYYGAEPYFTATHDGEKTPYTEGARNADRDLNTDRNLNVDRIRNTDAIAHANESRTSPSRLGYVQKATKLMGTSVKNLQDEKLGKVENLMVDLQAGRIVAVIVSSGGFLGLGDELSAIPPSALRFNTAKDTLQLDVSKEALSSAPHFKANQWPDLGQPSYADGVYRAYRVEPYFTTNALADADHTVRNIRDRGDKTLTPPDLGPAGADNTARNVRDRNDRTLNPLDQGNSAADVDTTARIRKEIIATKDMSVNARNVKIITANGRVTLRGPVNTAEEKRLIGDIAGRIANADHVDKKIKRI